MTTSITQPPVPFINSGGKADLADALATVKKEVMLALNCHHIGTIQSFDSDLQTATATINYTKNYFTYNASSKQYEPQSVPYPTLIDCPVVFLGGGHGALTFPVSKGDECLILFNDRDMNNWFDGNNNAPPLTPRLHSISDGIIIVGPRSFSESLSNFDATRACLRGNAAGTTIVGVGETLVKVANVTTSLGAILTQLMTALSALGTGLQANPIGEPAAFAAGAALDIAIAAIQTLVTGLLE